MPLSPSRMTGIEAALITLPTAIVADIQKAVQPPTNHRPIVVDGSGNVYTTGLYNRLAYVQKV